MKKIVSLILILTLVAGLSISAGAVNAYPSVVMTDTELTPQDFNYDNDTRALGAVLMLLDAAEVYGLDLDTVDWDSNFQFAKVNNGLELFCQKTNGGGYCIHWTLTDRDARKNDTISCSWYSSSSAMSRDINFMRRTFTFYTLTPATVEDACIYLFG